MSTSIKKPLQQKIEGSRKIQKRTDDEGENDAVAGKKQHQQEQGVATSSEGENRGEVDQRLEDSDSKLSHFSSTAPLTTSDYQSSTYETLPEAASVSDGGDVEKKIRPSDLLDFVDSALSENDHRLSERSSDPEGDSRNTDNSGSSSSSEDASTQDVLNEMNGVRDDIRIKQAASYAVTGSRLTAFPIDNEDDKMHLAKRISVVGTVVETPGAFSCDGEGNPLFKLSQDQLVHMGRLRHEQKKREATEDRNDAAFTVLNYNDDEDMIFEDDVVLDDIQARMHAFQNASNQEAEVQATKRSVNEQRKRRIRWAIVMIVVLLVVGISVGVFIGAQGSKKENDLPSLTPSFAPTLFDRNECYFATNDAEMTMRYLQMRSILALEFPILKVVIDTAGSDSRKVLCWLSDFDSLRIDASVVSEYDLLQRFALALIHYQVVPISGSLDDTLESTRWLSGDHECSWSFVSCNGTENVVLVDFGVIGATGTIPSELALLTKLLYVDFSTYSSSFRGTIPSELWSMDQLQVLNFGANSLTGTLSNDLKKLSDLRIFKVDQNLLSGTIPTEIGELTKLRILSLWENIDIGGAAPDLSALTNLGEGETSNRFLCRRLL